MVFSPVIIINSTPAVSITVADAGVPPITYAQVLNSLGTYVYLINSLYLYSSNISQLISTYNYNRYDSDGKKIISNVITTVDPYQQAQSLNVDLKDFATQVVLNGNSSVSTTLLPNVYLQFTLYAKRVTTSYGMNTYNFKELESIFRPEFFKDAGDTTIHKTVVPVDSKPFAGNGNISNTNEYKYSVADRSIGAMSVFILAAAAVYVLLKTKTLKLN